MLRRSFVVVVLLPLIMASFLLITSAEEGGENLVKNPSFDNDLNHWIPFNITSEMVRDTARYHSGSASVKILRTAERNAIKETEPTSLPDGVTQLEASYWGYRADDSHPSALVTMQLKVDFQDGTFVRHYPQDFRISTDEAKQWVNKSTIYTAPEGKTIQRVQVFLINNSVNQPDYDQPAWFDDIYVSIYEEPPVTADIGLVEPVSESNENGEKFNQVKNFLQQKDVPFNIITQHSRWENFKTIIVPAWDDSLSRKIRDQWYLGKRAMIFDIPESPRADLMMWYIFAYDPELSPPTSTLVSEEGRAVYMPLSELTTNPDEAFNVLNNLISAEFDYPDIPADNYDDQPVYTVEDGMLKVNGKPFYIRGPGFYNVGYFGGRTEVRDYEKELPELVEAGQNIVIGYADLNDSKEELVKFLDAVHSAGLKAMMWYRDDVSYSLLAEANAEEPGSEIIPMPWQDRYMYKILQLRNHPALLGYIVADDAHADYYPWIKRMRDMIKHYDQRNLVTATSLTLRNPDQLSPGEWDQWKEILDFPTTYIYPMHNYAPGIPRIGDAEGYDNLKALGDNVRSVWGDNAYFAFWPQAHMQGPVYESFGLSLSEPTNHEYMQESMQPFVDQQRLILYKTAMAGAKAQFIFTYRTANLDSNLGMGRKNEISSVFAELSHFDELFMSGTREEEVTGHDKLEATSFASDRSKVILLSTSDSAVETGYTRGGLHEGVTMSVDAPNEDVEYVYQIKGLDVISLPVVRNGNTLTITLKPFDTTALVFMSSDENLITSVHDDFLTNQARNARWYYNAVLDMRAKTEIYKEKITETVDLPEEVHAMMVQATGKIEAARSLIINGCENNTCYAEGYALSEEARLLYRDVQEELIVQAQDMAEEIEMTDRIKRQIGTLIGLPMFYHENFNGPEIGVWELGDAVIQRIQYYGGEIDEETPTIDSISRLIDTYKQTGDLDKPLLNQLENRLKQARHHLSKGSKQQANKHLKDFMKHLNNKSMEKYISEQAKNILTTDTKALIQEYLGKVER